MGRFPQFSLLLVHPSGHNDPGGIAAAALFFI